MPHFPGEMTMVKFPLRPVTACALALFALAARAADPTVCELPGSPLLTDPAGDQLLPQDDYDLLSLHLAQPASSDGTFEFTFTLKTPALLAPPPFASWFASFKAADGRIRGVRMDTDVKGSTKFSSYEVSVDNDGEQLGQFIEDGSQKPLMAGSGFDADGTITFRVKGADIGVTKAGDKIEKFNAGVIQILGAPGVASGSLNADAMPDDLAARTGSFTVNANGTCPVVTAQAAGEKAAVPGKFGAAFGWMLSLAGLLAARRRRR